MSYHPSNQNQNNTSYIYPLPPSSPLSRPSPSFPLPPSTPNNGPVDRSKNLWEFISVIFFRNWCIADFFSNARTDKNMAGNRALNSTVTTLLVMDGQTARFDIKEWIRDIIEEAVINRVTTHS